MAAEPVTTIARPARWRITLSDNAADAYPVELPAQRRFIAGLLVGAMFAGFAFAWWSAVSELLHSNAGRSVFDLASTLFLGAWVLGWSVATFALGAATVAVLFMHQSLRVSRDCLIVVSGIGPLNIVAEYERSLIRDLRVEPIAGSAGQARIKFGYGEGDVSVGGGLAQRDAEHVLARLQRLLGSGIAMPAPPAAAATPPPAAAKVPAATPAFVPPPRKPLSLTAPSSLALIAANLLPLIGVFSGHITLAQLMVLFWSENAIIGFFTLVKIIIAGRWSALLVGPFFAGHFGGFMAVHFMFVYMLFVGEPAGGNALPALSALKALYQPLWPLAGALLLSHAVSFMLNFIGRGEYRSATVNALMAAPYKRIVALHLTLIAGGWMAAFLHSTAPAVALLIALKLGGDLYAHTREHAAAPVAGAGR